MRWVRLQQRQFGRLVLALLVLAAMAPGISRLLHAGLLASAPSLALICSASGVVAGAMGSEGDASRMAAADHCPACLQPAHGPVPQPALLASFDLPALRHVTPRLFLWAPRPLFAWAAAQPRAPPLA